MTKRIDKDWYAASVLAVQAVLAWHSGPNNKIGMGELYEKVFKKSWSNRINDTRVLRKIIEDLRRQGMPLCSDTNGYWVTSSSSELNDYFNRAKSRALKTLTQISHMKRISLPELMGQMQMELEAGDEKTAA